MHAKRTSQPPRFIAGATCPNCGALDSIKLLKTDDDEIIECVSCGHTQSQKETEAKVQAEEQRKQAEAGVIGIFKPE